jgi:hypothetical protein
MNRNEQCIHATATRGLYGVGKRVGVQRDETTVSGGVNALTFQSRENGTDSHHVAV